MEETNTTSTTKKRGTGRKKLEINKIESKSSRIVTFCKRRSGLFKKAKELCTMADAKVAIVTFSACQRPYSFGHPSADIVIDQYLGNQETSPRTSTTLCLDGTSNCMNGAKLGNECEGQAKVGFWWERAVEDFDLEELAEYKASLQVLRDNVAIRVEDMGRRRACTRDFLGVFQ